MHHLVGCKMSRLITVPGSRSLSGGGRGGPPEPRVSMVQPWRHLHFLSGGDSESGIEDSPSSVMSPRRHRLHRDLSLRVGTMGCEGEEWRARPVMVGVPGRGEEVGEGTRGPCPRGSAVRARRGWMGERSYRATGTSQGQ